MEAGCLLYEGLRFARRPFICMLSAFNPLRSAEVPEMMMRGVIVRSAGLACVSNGRRMRQSTRQCGKPGDVVTEGFVGRTAPSWRAAQTLGQRRRAASSACLAVCHRCPEWLPVGLSFGLLNPNHREKLQEAPPPKPIEWTRVVQHPKKPRVSGADKRKTAE